MGELEGFLANNEVATVLEKLNNMTSCLDRVLKDPFGDFVGNAIRTGIHEESPKYLAETFFANFDSFTHRANHPFFFSTFFA